ncbi:MAG: response regulator, partial [bacterium]
MAAEARTAVRPVILVADDEPGIRDSFESLLKKEYDLQFAQSGEEVLATLQRADVNLILLDIRMPGMDGLATLARMRERQIDSQVVIISGHGNIESAVRAIKMGAFDFVEKPLSLEKTVLVVRNALRQRSLEAENRALRARVETQHTMVGESYA